MEKTRHRYDTVERLKNPLIQAQKEESEIPKGKPLIDENEAVLGQSERDFPSSDDEQVIDSLLLLC